MAPSIEATLAVGVRRLHASEPGARSNAYVLSNRDEALSLIQGTREYLQAFATAIETGSLESARQAILSRFPDHHVQQFLDVFSLPAYFPTPPPTESQKAG